MRQLENKADLKDYFTVALERVDRLLIQQKESKNKLFSVHAPEVECIGKGKSHKKFEFGVKTSIITTHKSNFVIGSKTFPGNPYDGHTLKEALDQVER